MAENEPPRNVGTFRQYFINSSNGPAPVRLTEQIPKSSMFRRATMAATLPSTVALSMVWRNLLMESGEQIQRSSKYTYKFQ